MARIDAGAGESIIGCRHARNVEAEVRDAETHDVVDGIDRHARNGGENTRTTRQTGKIGDLARTQPIFCTCPRNSGTSVAGE